MIFGPELTPWKNGQQALYNRYVNQIANGGVFQTSECVFEFRPNRHHDVIEWLQTTTHACILRVNSSEVEDAYRGNLKFLDKAGAMEFKLRWC